MFINERAERMVNAYRGKDGEEELRFDKSCILDIMCHLIDRYPLHPNNEEEEIFLVAINVLSNYADLITELSKEE